MAHIGKDRWRILSPLLDELLEADAVTRLARLAQIRREDAVLATELAALLERQSNVDQAGFLVGAAHPLPVEATLAGQEVGSYTLDKPLGRGGMGTVWLAKRSDGRYEGQAAIKFLNLALFARGGIERFKREGSVLARLTHPNIARLIDAGVTHGGQPYLVLEYIEGEAIDRWCDARSLDATARVRLFLQVLAAVAHAHGKLILHRDLKPSNILVNVDGQVKLLDFGIAKLLDDDRDGNRDAGPVTELTQFAGRPFTPDYAAPEQVQGAEVTTSTDVYSLGVLLYTLLTSHHPTAGVAQTPVDRLRAIVDTDPTRPSDAVSQLTAVAASGAAAELLQRARVLRGDLDNILLKALRKSPVERYGSVDAFADDLQRFLDHEPVSARADTVAYRLGKFLRRHRAGVTMTAIVVLGLLAATAVTTVQMLEARRQRDEAQYQSRRAESVSDFLDVLLLSEGGPDRPVLTLDERIKVGVDMLKKQYGSDPRFAGRMLVHLANRLSRSGETAPVLEMYGRAYELGKQANDLELMASAQCHTAETQGRAHMDVNVAVRMADARELLSRVRRPELLVRVECLLAQARIDEQANDLEAARVGLLATQRIIEDAHNTLHPMYVAVLSSLGNVYLERNNVPAVLEVSERVAAIQERAGRADTAEYFALQQNIAVALSLAGEVRESLARREVINQRVREFEPAGAEPFPYALNYAMLLTRMNRTEQAGRIVDGVLERARKAGNPLMLTQLLLAGAWSQIELKHWAQADSMLREAAPLVNGPVARLRAQFEMRSAQLALGRDDAAAARRHIESSLIYFGYRTAKQERSLSRALIVAADIALRQQLPAEAEQFATDAFKIGEPLARGPDSSADVGEALLRMAKARIAQGAPLQARPLLERAVRCLVNGLADGHPLTLQAQALLAGV